MMDSWQLTEFNLDGQIILSDKFGLIKLLRTHDGLLVLVGDGKYGLIDQEETTPASFVKTDSLLGFILDIGIQKTKRLTYGNGFYFGNTLVIPQSNKKISQANFNKDLFEKIGSTIDSYYQSGDKKKEQEGMRLQLLLDDYNNARLLFPNFYAESYLSLMRIIDAFADAQGGYNFATFVAGVSSELNQSIYSKINNIQGYTYRIQKALALFESCLKTAKDKSFPCYTNMSTFDDAGRLIFACFYSAYQYRSKFVHKGFPFPDTVKDTGEDLELGTAYLNPVMGISWSRFHKPRTGLENSDLIDIHEVVGEEAGDFKDTYFILLPTWHFLKIITREVILGEVNSLG